MGPAGRSSSLGGESAVWASDLLRLAETVYRVEALAGRSPSNPRTPVPITLSLVNPAPWRRNLELIDLLLNAVTGRAWGVALRRRSVVPPEASIVEVPLFPEPPFNELALFSTGLDALAYAADRARRGPEGLLLFGRSDAGIGLQGYLHRAVARIRPGVGLSWPEQSLNLASSDRSGGAGGLLQVALAVQVAARRKIRNVAVPRTRQLVVGQPLSAGTAEVCSARIADPATLRLINRLLWAVAEDGQPIVVSNRLAYRTKVEICRLAVAAGVDSRYLMMTVGCQRLPERGQHCGYCLDCLVRRAVFYLVEEDDRPCYPDTTRRPGAPWPHLEDLRRLRDWLAEEPAAAMPGGSPGDDALRTVIDRGRAELSRYWSG